MAPLRQFNDQMALGGIALIDGAHQTAIEEFERAYKEAGGREQTARALHAMGATHRLGGNTKSALRELKSALDCLDERSGQAGFVHRDLGLTFAQMFEPYLGMKKTVFDRAYGYCHAKAYEHFEKSFLILEKAHLPAEAAVALAFIGRLAFATGNKVRARIDLQKAVATFQGHGQTECELDTLSWLMRAAPKKERSSLHRRAKQLMRQTGQTNRRREFRLLKLGGDRLYRFVARPKSRLGIRGR